MNKANKRELDKALAWLDLNDDDATEIEWLVRADFLKKMKRVHLYFVSSASAAAASSAASFVYDSDSD